MRARNIKPGFFTNEQLAECSIAARLLFAGLWCMADRDGRLEYRPKRIKMSIFPADEIAVEPLLHELLGKTLLVKYEVKGNTYVCIPTFLKHQKPHPKEVPSVLPPYPGATQLPMEGGGNPADILNPDVLSLRESNPPTPLAGGRGSLPRSGRKDRDVRTASNVAWIHVTEGASKAYQRKELEAADPVLAQAVQRCGGWNKFGHSTAIGTLKAPFREAYEQLLEAQPESGMGDVSAVTA